MMSVLLGLGCLFLGDGGWSGKGESDYIVKLSVRKRPPGGLDRTESILRGSKSTRTARGTYLLALIEYITKICGQQGKASRGMVSSLNRTLNRDNESKTWPSALNVEVSFLN
jgi:hypothetical protein